MREHVLSREIEPKRARFVIMTPGQGTQFAGMGAKLAEHPAAASVFRETDEILGFSLSELMFDPSGEALKNNAIAQPAIVAATIAANEVFLAEHPEMVNAIPSFYIGHSLGELTALYFAGVLSGPNALIIAHERGKLMQQVAEQTPGSIVTIASKKQLDIKRIESICQQTGTFIASYNSPNQMSISGLSQNIEEAILVIKELGYTPFPLNHVPPSHTPLMEPAKEKLKNFLESFGIQFRNPHASIIMCLTGTEVNDGETAKQFFIEQLTHPVQFERGIRLADAQGIATFIEFGAKELLSKLIPKISPNSRSYTVLDIPTAKNTPMLFE